MSFLLQSALLDPVITTGLDNRELGQLVAQGRSSRLLATLMLQLEEAGVFSQLPDSARRHFNSTLMLHEKQLRDLTYDISHLRKAFDSIEERLVLLKGAAYLQAGLAVGRGRLISDIDIIVPSAGVVRAENALKAFGWENSQLDPYNERYYRQWMHEIPPLVKPRRGTTLDLHHTILPPTAKAQVNAELLFEDLIEIEPGIYTLSWKDMVIHSATHLFHEGEFHHGLRDLWDLDRMLRDFPNQDPSFWQELVARARQLDLSGPLFHGLNYARQVFNTPIPEDVQARASSSARRLRKPLMDFLFLRAFRPDQPECRLAFTDPALTALYVRSHYLRMPLHLLLPHLVRKAWMSRFGDDAASDEDSATEDAARH